MQLSEDRHSREYHVKGYEPGSVTVNDQHYTTSIIVSPDVLIPDWDETDFQSILQLKPELVLLGCGDQMNFISPDIHALFLSEKIGFEVMTNLSACKTFAAVAAEGRNVVLALRLNR